MAKVRKSPPVKSLSTKSRPTQSSSRKSSSGKSRSARTADAAAAPRGCLEPQTDPLLATLDALPIAVAISSLADGVILFANRHLCEALGWPCKELVGQPTRQFYVNLSDRKKLLERLRAAGEVRDMEVSIKRRDGARMTVTLSVQPIPFAGQSCLLSAMNDISERVRGERLIERERALLTRVLQVHERDRQLIGFELHDGLVQDLTAASLFLQAGVAELERAESAIPDSLRTADRTLQLAIAEARRLISGLQPPILAEAGLIVALATLVRRLAEDNGIDIQFTHAMQGMRVFPDVEMAVYRIIQEALNNAVQHSQAKRVTVRLRLHGSRVSAVVKDNGIGFHPKQVKRQRYGLVGMCERARLLGGSARIDSVPGKGTQVTVDLPIEDAQL